MCPSAAASPATPCRLIVVFHFHFVSLSLPFLLLNSLWLLAALQSAACVLLCCCLFSSRIICVCLSVSACVCVCAPAFALHCQRWTIIRFCNSFTFITFFNFVVVFGIFGICRYVWHSAYPSWQRMHVCVCMCVCCMCVCLRACLGVCAG